MELQQAVTFRREDHCPKCNTPRSIEVYNEKNQPLRYSLILDKIEDNNSLDIDLIKSSISFMACNRCRTKFIVDWSQGYIPRPLTYGRFYKQYLSNYGG